MDPYYLLLAIFLLAATEEGIKLLIIYPFKQTKYVYFAISLFPILEIAVFHGSVMQHSLLLAGDNNLASLIGWSVLIGARLFHVFSGLLYSRAMSLCQGAFYMAFCTVLHTSYNYILEFTPTLAATPYATLPWLFSLLQGALLFLFYKLTLRFAVRYLR